MAWPEERVNVPETGRAGLTARRIPTVKMIAQPRSAIIAAWWREHNIYDDVFFAFAVLSTLFVPPTTVVDVQRLEIRAVIGKSNCFARFSRNLYLWHMLCFSPGPLTRRMPARF